MLAAMAVKTNEASPQVGNARFDPDRAERERFERQPTAGDNLEV
jgi:hypothetical protein